MLKRLLYSTFLMAVGTLMLMFYMIFDRSPTNRLESYLFSRIRTSDVRIFINHKRMHSAVFIYFKSSNKDLSKIISILELNIKASIPIEHLEEIDYAKLNSGWHDFNWAKATVFYRPYCIIYKPSNRLENGFDILLDDNGKAIYVTAGNISSEYAFPVTDINSCDSGP